MFLSKWLCTFVLLVNLTSLSGTPVPGCSEIFRYIEKHLPCQGTLEQDAQGFTYVNVSDDYIHCLYPLIQESNIEPPLYFGPGLHGAHITVLTAEEAKEHDLIGHISEVGTKVCFKLVECSAVEPPSMPKGTTFYLLVVNAPILDQLRKKYHLDPAKYKFHITIGTRSPTATAA